MKIMTAFLVAILVATCSTNIVDDPRVFRQVLRKPGDDNSKTYRIPDLATTPKGTLVTVFDIRYGSVVVEGKSRLERLRPRTDSG